MFSWIVGLIGVKAFFIISLLGVTTAAPAGKVLKFVRPILGIGLYWFGLASQVVFGVVVSLALVSDTVWAWLLG